MEHLANKDNETLGINDLTALQTLLEKDLELLFNIISQTDNKEIIFVSDELGMGIVPANAMSRVYRDLVGLANQYVAQKAEIPMLRILVEKSAVLLLPRRKPQGKILLCR